MSERYWRVWYIVFGLLAAANLIALGWGIGKMLP
jgi:hypothetical protein